MLRTLGRRSFSSATKTWKVAVIPGDGIGTEVRDIALLRAIVLFSRGLALFILSPARR